MCSTISPKQHHKSFHHNNMFNIMDSPKSATTTTLFSKFLKDSESDTDSPYSSDQFRIYEFKVRKCTRSRSHDWTDCPFAHPGEKARRRDPRKFHYTGTICSEYRKTQHCTKGDECEYAHGVFECWLHPTRYRTEACKDGKSCKRKVCFFAHSTLQLRSSGTSIMEKSIKYGQGSSLSGGNCCGYCCHCSDVAVNSPTSTLMGSLSNFSSPPVSPNMRLIEVMASLEAMRVSELAYQQALLSVDQQGGTQFLMSPSGSSSSGSGYSEFSTGRSNFNMYDDEVFANNMGGPDLGWVNDLLT